MYNSAPEAGLASLLASRGRNGDSVLVHMAPQEVAGLQQLAMAHGGSLTINPETGLYEASFLKKLLPMIAGAVLNTFAPGVGSAVGSFFGASGAAASTLGTGLLVGGATALIEGDLKKGLMAGLGAYSGANLAQSFQQAAIPTAEKLSPEELAKTNQAIEAAKETVGARPVYNPTGTETDGLDYFKSANVYRGTPTAGDLAIGRQAIASGATTPDQILDYTKSANVFRGIPTPADLAAGRAAIASGTGVGGIFQGAQNVLTSPDARRAFGQGLSGGFQSPFAQNVSRYATFAGAADALTPEYEMPSSGDLDDTVYIAGGFNPNYGLGQQYGKFLPGQYYKKTKNGLVPYNPYQLAPGYSPPSAVPGVRGAATGGLMQAPDQNMNQQRAIPHQYQPLPNPNQNYPLSTVMQANYQANSPQPREVISGYETKIDPYTGEERFAAGGGVDDKEKIQPDPYGAVNTPINPFSAAPPAGVAPGAGGRGDPPMVAINAPYTEADARKRYEQMIYAPPPPKRSVQPMEDFLNNLSQRLKSPPIYAYPPGGIVTPPGGGGGGGTIPGGPGGGADKGEPGGGRGSAGSGPIAGGGGMPGGGISTGVGGGRGSGLPTGGQTGVGAGGSNYYDTFDPNIQDQFPVDIDPTEEVDKALGNTIKDKAKQKFMDWFDKRFRDPYGIAGTAIGFTGAGMLGTYVWDKLTPKIQEFFVGLDKVLTPQEAAEAEAEAIAAAKKIDDERKAAEEKEGREKRDTRGREGNVVGGGYAPSPFGPSTGGGGFGGGRRGFITIDEDIKQSAKGGRIKAMQMGGMTAPNPYGAAVGEDFNFGFSGGGEMPTEYLAGGKLLEGEGDGMSDSIPAVIRGKGVQRAALADGEFVVPADVVSHLGNGSTKAGAKKLYAMMDRIREARTGRTRQAPAVKADKYLPA